MPTTYKALLKGDCLEWSGDGPTVDPNKAGVAVSVTILEEPAMQSPTLSHGEQMAAALACLANLRDHPQRNDPSAWEHEIRHDRSLPDREQ